MVLFASGLRLFMLLITAALAIWLGFVAREIPWVYGLIQSGGYTSVFLFSLINGFNVFVPVVTASFVPAFVGAGMNPYILVFLISLGMSIADCTAFLLARAGRAHLPRSGIRLSASLQKAGTWRHSFPLYILGAWTFVPLPNELIVIPLALLGYQARAVFPIVFVGNLAANTLISFGLLDLVRQFGI